MAQDDPLGAMDWASSLPNELAAKQKRHTYNEWRQKDEAAAGEWLSTQSPGLTKVLMGNEGE